jgi:hypothetical protein
VALTIWKKTKPIGDEVALILPAPCAVVHIACETPDSVTFWAEVDPDEDAVTRTFYVRGTGHLVPLDAEHVVSCVARPFVWHIYRKDEVVA